METKWAGLFIRGLAGANLRKDVMHAYLNANAGDTGQPPTLKWVISCARNIFKRAAELALTDPTERRQTAADNTLSQAEIDKLVRMQVAKARAPGGYGAQQAQHELMHTRRFSLYSSMLPRLPVTLSHLDSAVVRPHAQGPRHVRTRGSCPRYTQGCTSPSMTPWRVCQSARLSVCQLWGGLQS